MTQAVAVELDGALGDTRPLWRAFVEDAARRFASIAPLDPAVLPSDRAAASAELDRWAAAGVGDWRRALNRFVEDHAPIYLRPDPRANAALRTLAARGLRIGIFTDAPTALADAALAHLGLARHVDAVESGGGALDRLRGRFGEPVHVVESLSDLLALAGQLELPATRR